MDSLEVLVKKMECQMDRADSKLDFLTTRLDGFERRLLMNETTEDNPPNNGTVNNKAERENDVERKGDDSTSERGDDDDNDGLDPKLLTELLVEVRRVKEEYGLVLQGVHEVQELQQEVTRSLREQMKQVQSHFDHLRERVIGSSGGTALPPHK